KDLDAPVALVEDGELLAAGPLALEFVLSSLCTPTQPTCDLARLKRALPPKLRPAFETAFARRVESRDLPPGVSVLQEKKKKLLYLDRCPPPPAPEVSLADDLLRTLRARRRSGGDSYPLTLARLVELSRPGADAKLVQEALAIPAFRQNVLIALAKEGK